MEKKLFKALFGCMCVHLNPRMLEWNGTESSSNPLQYTSTYVDLDEYMRNQIRPKRGRKGVKKDN